MMKSFLHFQLLWAVFREKAHCVILAIFPLLFPFIPITLIFYQVPFIKMAEVKSRDYMASKNPCTYANPIRNPLWIFSEGFTPTQGGISTNIHSLKHLNTVVDSYARRRQCPCH